MTIVQDPDAESRSLMNRQPCVCDGERTGIPCKHFWSVIQKFDAANADTVRRGESNRACTLMTGWPLEFVSEEKPTYCTRYEPRKTPGLIALVQRAVLHALSLGLSDEQQAGRETVRRGGMPLYDGVLGPDPELVFPGWAKFDRYFNEFKPITETELKDLRVQFPDKPEGIFRRGKHPMSMSVSDIADSEPIGMLKPGEQIPGSLSAASTEMLDDIFKSEEKPVEPVESVPEITKSDQVASDKATADKATADKEASDKAALDIRNLDKAKMDTLFKGQQFITKSGKNDKDGK